MNTNVFSLFGFFLSLAVLVYPCRPGSAQEVKTTPIGVRTVRTFKDLEIKRPIVVTHAGDGTNRLFVASQLGEIFVMPNDQNVSEPAVFLDLSEKVVYKDKENEEGLLGLAFHPKFRENGEFFVYYTTTDAPHTSVVSRFRVSKNDPNKANPNSEQEILRVPQPFWNHNGGTICFGPDGFLYIALGDGGFANDPQKNGQNLSTWLGSILRIDVDHKSGDLAYAIPQDNPFLKTADARPEIYAYGLRNVWRMSFDRKTGTFYAADVGQDLWEEVDIIEAGGNYGWNRREGKHKFGPDGVEANDKMIEPIWEYPHSVGKSITGGGVYRGKKAKSLDGVYLFADYVTGFVWGLRYDEKSGKVTAHHEISGEHFNQDSKDFATVITFGEDEQGEVYFTDAVGRFFTFEPAEK